MSPYNRGVNPRERRFFLGPPTRAMVLTEEKAAPIFADSPQAWLIRAPSIASSRLPLRISVVVGSQLLGEVTVTECMSVKAGQAIDAETEASYDQEAWDELDMVLQSRHHRIPHIYRLRDPKKYDPPQQIRRKAGQSSWVVL